MNSELTWNGMKKQLWKAPIKELQEKLEELKKEKIMAEMVSRGYSGDPQVPMSLGRKATESKHPVNLKNIRHRIACIKTMLKVRQK